MIPSAYSQLTQGFTFPGSNPLDGMRPYRPRTDNADDLNQKYLELSLSNVLPSYPLSNPFEQVAHYKSAVYLGIQTLMDALSGATVLFEVKSDGTDGSPAPGAQRTDDEYVPLPGGHVLLDKIRKPNPSDTFAAFLSKCVLQYHLTGRLLIWMVPNENGLPVRFYVLPTALVNQAFNVGISARYPLGAWRVQQLYPSSGLAILPGPWSGQLGTVLDARQLMIIQNPHPLFPWAPYSPLTGMDVQMDVMEMIDRSAWSIYRQGVRPTGLFDLPGAGPEQVEAFQAQVANKYGGADNHGVPLVMGGGRPDRPAGKFQQIAPTGDQMAYETRAVYEGLILTAVTGQDRGVVGLREGGSYAERWAAIQDVRNRKYEPWLGKIASALTDFVLAAWGLTEQGVRCAIRLPRMNDPTLISAETAAMASDGTGTVDEVRARRGLGPHPSGLGSYPPQVMQQLILAQFTNDEGQVQYNPTTGAGDDLEENDDTATGNVPTENAVTGQGADATDVELDEPTALGTLMSTMRTPEGGTQYPAGAKSPRTGKGGGGGSGSLGGKGSHPAKKKNPGTKQKKPDKAKKIKKSMDSDGMRKYIAANPHDIASHAILADALDDEGKTHEAALHRYIGQPTDEHREALVAAHGGTTGAAHAMTVAAHNSLHEAEPFLLDADSTQYHTQNLRAGRHATSAATHDDETLRSGHHANAEHAHFAVAQALADRVAVADKPHGTETHKFRYAQHLHTLAHGLHKQAWDELNPLPGGEHEVKSGEHAMIRSYEAGEHDPTDALARGVYADALEEVGRGKEAAAHRWVAERTPERFGEVLASHGGSWMGAVKTLAPIGRLTSLAAYSASRKTKHAPGAAIAGRALEHANSAQNHADTLTNEREFAQTVSNNHVDAWHVHERAVTAHQHRGGSAMHRLRTQGLHDRAITLHDFAAGLHRDLSADPYQDATYSSPEDPREVKSEADLEAHRRHVEANPTDKVARLTYSDHLEDHGLSKDAAIQRVLAEPHNPEYHEGLRAAGGTLTQAAFEASKEAETYTSSFARGTSPVYHASAASLHHARAAQASTTSYGYGSTEHLGNHERAVHGHDTTAEEHSEEHQYRNADPRHVTARDLHRKAFSIHIAAWNDANRHTSGENAQQMYDRTEPPHTADDHETKSLDAAINPENLIAPPVQTTPAKLKRKRKVLAKEESQLLVRSIIDRITQEPARA